jgi:hypothetical protein
MDYPLVVLVASTLALWLCAWIGANFFRKRHPLDEEARGDYGVVLTSTLTLLGLIIGFTFSMALNRYDQRKNYEEQEANAIGTEYVRADLLPAASAEHARALLRTYTDQRILFYDTRDDRKIQTINAETARLQADLWSAVRGPASAQPDAVVALVVAGMNDVLNSQGYTQAAWWNRIPTEAWVLMGMIAICGNMMLGYGAKGVKSQPFLIFIPLVTAIAFSLIADIDSPRGGLIKVRPQNLLGLSDSIGRAKPG